jgi:hypothetical protein
LHSAIELKYEDLCSDQLDTSGRLPSLVSSSGRQSSRDIKQRELKNANDKYKRDLTTHQQRDLDEVPGD